MNRTVNFCCPYCGYPVDGNPIDLRVLDHLPDGERRCESCGKGVRLAWDDDPPQGPGWFYEED
jgi:hypothetical protein